MPCFKVIALIAQLVQAPPNLTLTKFVKVRLGGACTSCAMSAMTLKQGIQNKIFQDIPDCNGVIQVL